jgi:hypothetical protein
MLGLTAEIVAAATGTEQVGNRRGRVQHVATAPALTPTGLLRRGCRPVCGQHARRWAVLDEGDPRPLCFRCTTWALRRCPNLPDEPYLQATPEQIRDGLLAVSSWGELHRLVYAICRRSDLVKAVLPDPAFGKRRLTAYVPEARARLATPPTSRPRREAPGSRYPRRVR